jgi:hypothetical protein
VVVLGDPNDRFDHIWEAAATASSLLQRMIDFRGHDQGPRILIEKLDDRLFDVLFGDDVAVTNQHFVLWNG